MSTIGHYPSSFVKTITVDNRPLVLRFVKDEDEPNTHYEINCINDKSVPVLRFSLQGDKWTMTDDVPEAYRPLEQRLAALILDACL